MLVYDTLLMLYYQVGAGTFCVYQIYKKVYIYCMKMIYISLCVIFLFLSCENNMDNDNTPKTNYITWNSFRVKWKINKENINKDILYHIILFTDENDYEKLKSMYINGYSIDTLKLWDMDSMKSISFTKDNSIEIKSLNKNTKYYVLVIEADKIENIYNFYPITYAITSTAHFIKKLFEIY
jgi:hypothetical protein